MVPNRAMHHIFLQQTKCEINTPERIYSRSNVSIVYFEEVFVCWIAVANLIVTRCEIYSKLTIKTPERCQWRRSGVFIVNF